MSEPRIVTEQQLKPVLDVLARLEWPIPFKQAPSIIMQVGWQFLTTNVARSNLPVSLRTTSVLDLDGDLSSVEFRVSDTVKADDKAGRQVLAEAFPKMSAIVTDCLGFPPTGELWGHPGLKWDLPSGGRVNLPAGLSALQVQIWSNRLADIERVQVSHGVDPEHDLDDVA